MKHTMKDKLEGMQKSKVYACGKYALERVAETLALPFIAPSCVRSINQRNKVGQDPYMFYLEINRSRRLGVKIDLAVSTFFSGLGILTGLAFMADPLNVAYENSKDLVDLAISMATNAASFVCENPEYLAPALAVLAATNATSRVYERMRDARDNLRK